MEPEIWHDTVYLVDTNCGLETIPMGVCGEWDEDREPAINRFADYIEGDRIFSVEEKTGWCFRLAMPGCLDCTDTSFADSELEAIEEILSLYGNECGEPEDWEADLEERLSELKKQSPSQ